MESEGRASDHENESVYEVSSLVEQLVEVETTTDFSHNQLKHDRSLKRMKSSSSNNKESLYATSDYSLEIETEVNDDKPSSSSSSVLELDHWSKWLLRKEMEHRERKYNENVEKQQEINESKKTLMDKQFKIKVATDNWKSQLLVKNKKSKAKYEKFKQQMKESEAFEEQQKLEKQQRCSNEYRRWMSKKSEEIKENKLKLQLELELSKSNCERIKRDNSGAYDKWLSQSTAKPLPKNRSYGISAGKLISWTS